MVSNANVHQLIAMKAYILELDSKLQSLLEQNKHIQKKYLQYKEKYHHLHTENKQIIQKFNAMLEGYKGKVNGYEALVFKLTEELEEQVKSNEEP